MPHAGTLKSGEYPNRNRDSGCAGKWNVQKRGLALLGELFLDPLQNCWNQRVVKFAIHSKQVVHSFNFQIARLLWMHVIYRVGNRARIRAAHDGVVAAINYQHWSVDFLPHCAQIQRLQLLIKSCGPAVLPIRRVIPGAFPTGMLADNFSRCHSLQQIQIVKFREDLYLAIYFRGRTCRRREPPSFVLQHVLVPRAPPTAGGNISTHRVLTRDQRGKPPAIAEPQHKNAIQVDEVIF